MIDVQANHTAYWRTFVTTALCKSNLALGNQPIPDALERAQRCGAFCPAQLPVTINYTDRSWNWDWSTHQTTYVAPPRPQAEKTDQEKRDERAAQAKVIGSILTVAGAFLFGFAAKAYSRASQTLHTTQQADRAIHTAYTELCNEKQWLANDLSLFVSIERLIDTTHFSKIQKYTVAALGTLVGAGMLAGGGFAAIPVLMTAGTITLVASTALAAFTCAWHWSDLEDLKINHRTITELAPAILGQLDRCGATLTSVRSAEDIPPPPYEDLFAPSAPPYPGTEPEFI